MEKSIGIKAPMSQKLSFQNLCNINPKQEREDDWRSSPLSKTDTRNESPKEDLSWAITPVIKVEDISGFEPQNLQQEAHPFQSYKSYGPLCPNNANRHGNQMVGSSAQNDAVYSPAPLSARAPVPSDVPSLNSLQRPVGVVRGGPPVAAFTVQCSNCLKWRMIPTKEQYEAIRQCILEKPWVCENARSWRPGASCEDPTDFSQDSTALWAIDRPNIPRPPPGWERKLVIRGEGSTRFGDIYYHSPCGKKLRSMVEVDRFLKEHPDYVRRGVNLYQFSYSIPQPLKEGYVRRRKREQEMGDLSNRSTAAKFLLQRAQVKQLGDTKWQAKSMRGSLKGVFGKLNPRNDTPSSSRIPPAPVQHTFSEIMVPCHNGHYAGGKSCLESSQLCLGRPLKVETSDFLPRAALGYDSLSSDVWREVDASCEKLNRASCEVDREANRVSSDSMENMTYPFASQCEPESGVPLFWKKKLRTGRVSPVIDLESNLNDWRPNEQENMLESYTPCANLCSGKNLCTDERLLGSHSLTYDLSKSDLTQVAASFPGLVENQTSEASALF